MQCKQCGATIQNHANFCPKCGAKILPSEYEDATDQKNPARGLRILFGFLVGVIALMLLFFFLSDGLTSTVSDQLKLLKEGKVQEAYDKYTSKAFQEATSFEHFQSFMDVYPSFTKHQSVRFVERDMGNDRASLQAMILTDQGLEIPVQYLLIKEDGKWKIESIKLNAGLNTPQESNPVKHDEIFDSKPLSSTIQAMMEQIKQNRLKEAYEEYTAQEFKKNTSLKAFEEFIKGNSGFSTYVTVNLGKLTFDNNVATLTGILKTQGGVDYPVEYDLIQENSKWKIFHIQILHPDQKSNEAGSSWLSKLILGTALNDEGTVISPTTLFKTTSGDIYVNVFVDNADPNTQIKVLFEHLTSQSSIPPVTSHLSKTGDARLTFIFSPPSTGWPKGQYKLLATSSTGDSRSIEFAVEE